MRLRPWVATGLSCGSDGGQNMPRLGSADVGLGVGKVVAAAVVVLEEEVVGVGAAVVVVVVVVVSVSFSKVPFAAVIRGVVWLLVVSAALVNEVTVVIVVVEVSCTIVAVALVALPQPPALASQP